MENFLFSNLVYRIIGEPDKWQFSSSEKMHAFLDQEESIDAPEYRKELEMGKRIIERITDHDDVLTAFRTFLEDTHYGMVIFDDSFLHIFHNHKANDSMGSLLCAQNKNKLNASLIGKIKQCQASSKLKSQENNLTPIKTDDRSVYFKVIKNHDENESENEKTFYVLFLPVQNNKKVTLHEELKSKYQLTTKEESVLIQLMDGNSLQEIADLSFVTRHTVKSQLKSIFSKTGTNSQPALILLFLNHEVQLLESHFDFKLSRGPDDLDDKFVTLKGKHTLCYREYGPRDGFPIIVLHNNHGCRFNIPHDFEEHCKNSNRRIIIPDRPGYGKSPSIEGYPANWNELLSHFIDTLKLKKFDLIGNILGTALAINYANSGDQRLRKLILTSPVFINELSHHSFLSEILYPAARLIDGSAEIAIEVYQLWLKSMSVNIESNMRGIFASSIGDNEKHMIESPEHLQVMIRNFSEAQAQSIEGSSNDMVFSLMPLNIDLSELTVPMDLWIGSQDNMISLEGFKTIFDPIPNKTIHLKEGYGRDIYYSLFSEIISD